MSAPVRLTKQRQAVIDELANNGAFRTAQDVHLALANAGTRIGLATVYRTLQALADAGDVDVLQATDGTLRYRRCRRRDHHHHLVCRNCAKAIEIDGPSVESWTNAIGARYGFAEIEHVVELHGTCATCLG